MIHRTKVQSAIAHAEIELRAVNWMRYNQPLVQLTAADLSSLVAAAKSASYHCINPMAMTSAAYESPSDYIEGT